MPLYSEEQVERANGVDLEQYLRSRGEKLVRIGSDRYKWVYSDGAGEHDSVTIYGNKWYDHKNQVGGRAINFLKDYYGYDFRGAVNELLNGEIGNAPIENNRTSFTPSEPEKAEFKLPEPAPNMKRLFAYLIKTRYLSPDVVRHFVHQKSMYQDKRGNVVFLGLDEKGKARNAIKKSTGYSIFKGTVAGSEVEYGFHHKGTSGKLFVFEAPIDMLSYISLYPENWQAHSYIAMDGLSPKLMIRFIEAHRDITEIHLGLDVDEAGREAHDKFQNLLLEKGYGKKSIHWAVPYIYDEANGTRVLKDWNEVLKAQNGEEPVLGQLHPKTLEYGKQVTLLEKAISNIAAESYPTLENGLDTRIQKTLDEYYHRMAEKIVPGRITRISDSSIIKDIRAMAGTAVIAASVLKTKDTGEPYLPQELLVEMEQNYKPYLDRHQLKPRLVDFEKQYTQTRKFLASAKGPKEQAEQLQKFADQCIRLIVYTKVRYQIDLARQEALLHSSDQTNSNPELEPQIQEEPILQEPVMQ